MWSSLAHRGTDAAPASRRWVGRLLRCVEVQFGPPRQSSLSLSLCPEELNERPEAAEAGGNASRVL